MAELHDVKYNLFSKPVSAIWLLNSEYLLVYYDYYAYSRVCNGFVGHWISGSLGQRFWPSLVGSGYRSVCVSDLVLHQVDPNLVRSPLCIPERSTTRSGRMTGSKTSWSGWATAQNLRRVLCLAYRLAWDMLYGVNAGRPVIAVGGRGSSHVPTSE